MDHRDKLVLVFFFISSSNSIGLPLQFWSYKLDEERAPEVIVLSLVPPAIPSLEEVQCSHLASPRDHPWSPFPAPLWFTRKAGKLSGKAGALAVDLDGVTWAH